MTLNLDMNLFLEMLHIDSTSGNERALSDFLAQRLPVGDCHVSSFPEDAAPDRPVNLLFSWGMPKIVFCTHLDTVPPYFPPSVEKTSDGTVIHARGACDAKGQIFAMYSACARLAAEGHSGFGLLLLYGEETGSFGAKEYRDRPGGEYVIVGEPTDNCMVSASKGTKSFEIAITGSAFHSGYPQHGISAVNLFIDMANKLRAVEFPEDPLLGDTTYNIGKLMSDNPQNILSPHLTCRIYFRTTFASDKVVGDVMASLADENIEIKPLGGDTPMHYLTLPGFPTKTVAFGSDAPQLTNFKNKILCGPGSILTAHRDNEHIRLDDIYKAIDNYINMYHTLQRNISD